MTNFKRTKPKRYAKVFRGGVDGPDCSWCGSNWAFKIYMKQHLIEWEQENEQQENEQQENEQQFKCVPNSTPFDVYAKGFKDEQE